MDAVSAITGLEVQYYAMINLKGFENLIDSLGGITVVSGKRVPISSKVDPKTGQHGPVKGWIEPGKQKLDGHHALWFARSREFSSDYERMIRQRCVQTAMVKQLDPATVLTRYQAIAKATPGLWPRHSVLAGGLLRRLGSQGEVAEDRVPRPHSAADHSVESGLRCGTEARSR
jgi:anionic cell wall polymer biosynthesis LytR-Cps2A-Psr (LCP) family protein